MKKITLLIIIVAFFSSLYSQIRMVKSAKQLAEDARRDSIEAEKNRIIEFYDSLTEFVDKKSARCLIGQELIFRPLTNRKYNAYGGYEERKTFYYPYTYTSPQPSSKIPDRVKHIDDDLYKEIEAEKKIVYAPIRVGDYFYSQYDSLVGQQFKIVDVVIYDRVVDRKIFEEPYLQLEDGKRTIFYEYHGRIYDREYIRIIGYLKKIEQTMKLKQYVSKGFNVDNFETGQVIKIPVGQKVAFEEIILDPKNGDENYLFRTIKGEPFSLPYMFLSNLTEKKDLDKIRKRYGEYCSKMILQNKIYIGMPADAVKLSWGEPKSINSSSYGPDQWVYGGNYVYIQRGVVTAWN